MKTLSDYIRLATFVAPVVADEDSEPTSDIIDTMASGGPFDAALIRASIGTFGADLTNVKVKIQESNDDDFSDSSETTMDGGAEQTATEAGELVFQVTRTKRYIRAVVTMTASGAADTAPVAITGILHNWAKPLPVV